MGTLRSWDCDLTWSLFLTLQAPQRVSIPSWGDLGHEQQCINVVRSFLAGRINDPVAHGKVHVYLRNTLYVYSTFFFLLTSFAVNKSSLYYTANIEIRECVNWSLTRG